MRSLIRSHFISGVIGGLVVAGAFLALGITGRRTTQEIVAEGPVAAQPASSGNTGLTPHGIYERDAPGVVFVRARVVEQVQNPFDFFPQQQSSSSTGSGFLVDSSGDILTNNHVIQGANRTSGVSVQFEDNVLRSATVVGEDQNDDLAVLRVNMGGVPAVRPLVLGDSSSARVGDPTLAIGNPFGLDRTLTSGIVSALQRQIQAPNGFSIDNVIQTDAPINPGNSGGPLLDADGRVIGINSQIATGGGEGNGSVGIAFAVPIDTAKQVLASLEHGGAPQIAYLGIAGDATPGSAPGVTVVRATPGGPAAVAGVRQGDAIEAVNGRRVSSMVQVQTLVTDHNPGQQVVLRIRRARHTLSIRVTLGTRPEQAPRQG
jgi:S1-C subfamily serine protease